MLIKKKSRPVQKGTISVIVPIHNVEGKLKHCIDSILAQTYDNLQILLIDDGSTDNSGVICNEYAKVDSRVVVVHKKNEGVAVARNTGLDLANGEFIGFVDSDDYIASDMYEIMLKEMIEKDSDIVICNYYLVYEDRTVESRINDETMTREDVFTQLQGEQCWDYIPFWNKLYRGEIFDEIRCPVGKLHEDNYIVHEVLAKCKAIQCIAKPLYFYVQRKGSIMHSEINIRRMDNIEALYNRYLFYIHNGYNQYLQDLAKLVVMEYDWTRWYVKLNTQEERRELKQIDYLLKKLLIGCNARIPFRCRIPNIYFYIINIKSKISAMRSFLYSIWNSEKAFERK